MGKKRYPAKVFTRLRPVSSGEKDGHGEGDAVDKQLSGFDETSMSISGRNGDVEKFDFMDAVIGPEKTQEEVYGMARVRGVRTHGILDANRLHLIYGGFELHITGHAGAARGLPQRRKQRPPVRIRPNGHREDAYVSMQSLQPGAVSPC
jgi:hypothetical protein